jgi:hypothetical protein
MSNTDTQTDALDARGRDVIGCLMSAEYSSFTKGDVPGILRHCQAQCSSPELLALMANMGLRDPTVHPNPHLQKGATNHVFDKFQKAVQKLDPHCSFGVVFHGTPPHNIATILEHGLDPKKRSGQAYGPGEYFSKDGALSLSYCKGGLEMILFVVVLPSTLPEEEEKASKDAKVTAFDLQRNKKYHAIPKDTVVVQNNDHQIPIATIKFNAVDRNAMTYSMVRRAKFMELSREVFNKSQDARETVLKEKIMRMLISGEIDVAAEKYAKARSILKHSSKRELAWYVHQNMDEEVIPFYFEELPEPMKPADLEKSDVKSVEEAEKMEKEAKEKLETERKNVVASQSGGMTSGCSNMFAFGSTAALATNNAGTASGVQHQPPIPAGGPVLGAGAVSGRQAVTANNAHPNPAAGHGLGSTVVATASSVLFAANASHGSSTGIASNTIQPVTGATPPSTNLKLGNPSSTDQKGSNNNVTSTVILQHLIAGKVDLASEMYQNLQNGQSQPPFAMEEQQDFYFYVKRIVDPDLVDFLFPGLQEANETPCPRTTTTVNTVQKLD